MSRAFDTIRDTIINILKDAGCSWDDIRVVQYLLPNTFIRVRVNSSLSEEFESLLGAFQGKKPIWKIIHAYFLFLLQLYIISELCLVDLTLQYQN